MKKFEKGAAGRFVAALLFALAMGMCTPCRAQAMAQMSVSDASSANGGSGARSPATVAATSTAPATHGGKRRAETIDPGLLNVGTSVNGNSPPAGAPVKSSTMDAVRGPRQRGAQANLMAAGRPAEVQTSTAVSGGRQNGAAAIPPAHPSRFHVPMNPMAGRRTLHRLGGNLRHSVNAMPRISPATRAAPATGSGQAPQPADRLNRVIPAAGVLAAANRGSGSQPRTHSRTVAPGAGGPASTAPTQRNLLTRPSRIESMPISGSPGVAGRVKSPPASWFSAGAAWRSIFRVVGALGIVLGLLLVGRTMMARFGRKLGVGPDKQVFEILSRHALCKNQSLVMVRIGSQIVVLNQGKESSQSVLVVSDPVEVAKLLGQVQGTKETSIQAGFKTLLSDARRDMETQPPSRTQRFNALADAGGYAESSGRLAERADDGAPENLDNLDDQLDEMAAARRQLMELRQQVQSVRQKLPVDA